MKMRVVALVASILLAACGTRSATLSAPTFAQELCGGIGLQTANAYTMKGIARLDVAIAATAREVADWQESGYHGPNGPRLVRSDWRDVPAREPVALCYYDGPFDNYSPSMPRPLPGTRPSPPVFERALFIVDTRSARLVTIGAAGTLPRMPGK